MAGTRPSISGIGRLSTQLSPIVGRFGWHQTQRAQSLIHYQTQSRLDIASAKLSVHKAWRIAKPLFRAYPKEEDRKGFLGLLKIDLSVAPQ